ncbi:MAG TPA: acetate--CoA ligase family protein, partial [Gaiellales bacterium]|nr:acetate--CoA ligase family protein [Gaiellales bacterium]
MTRDLTPLFDPASVAILGASADPAKWGHWLARGALRGSGRRPVYLINRNGGQILGHPVHRSILDVPERPDLVVVSVPEAAFEQAVDDSLSMGARAIVGITAGLGERGGESLERERALAGRVRDAGALLLGPNCIGVFDSTSELGLLYEDLPPGSIGLISQSGNLALELGLLAADHGIGFSRFASVGNQADVNLVELVGSYAAHDETRLIAVYAEDFHDGRAFVDAVAACGKPVLLLTVGRSAAGQRAARSHTGALVSDLAVVEAACRAAGATVVSTPAEMIDLAAALLGPRRSHGRRVAVLGDGGGHGAIASDVATGHGLELPELSDALSAAIASQLPSTAATRNPVDLAGGGEQDMSSYANISRMLLQSGEVDALLLTGYFGGYSQGHEGLRDGEVGAAQGIVAAATATGRPVVVQTMYPHTPTSRALRAGGIPVYRTIESAAGALVAIGPAGPPRGAPVMPAAQNGSVDPGYFGARELLERAGLEFVPAVRVHDVGEAVEAGSGIGYPVVLKAIGLLHKSDAGGVIVGIADGDELARAVADLQERLAPPEMSVERMAPLADGVELIVGARRDPRFGVVAMVGMGGLYAETFRDVAVGLGPLADDQAAELIRSLRGAPLLAGARGRPPLDVAAAGRAAAALSRVAAERPDIA